MFTAKCFDDDGKPFPASLLFAEAELPHPLEFVKQVYGLADILNGLPKIQAKVGEEKLREGRFSDLRAGLARGAQFAIMTFMGATHTIPGFSREECSLPSHPNFHVFKGFSELMEAGMNDQTAKSNLAKLIQQLKVPGVKVQFFFDLSLNQQRLHECGFPDELIPAEFLCELTGEMMTVPAVDKCMPKTALDISSWEKSLADKQENPFNRQPLKRDNLAILADLKNKIDLFMAKVTCICDLFPDDVAQFHTYIKILQDATVSLAVFTEEVKANWLWTPTNVDLSIWESAASKQLIGDVSSTTRDFFKILKTTTPVTFERFNSSTKRIIEFGIGSGVYLKESNASAKRACIGYDFAKSSVAIVEQLGMTARLIDLENVRASGQLRYHDKLEADLSVSVDVLAICLFEYLSPHATLSLLFTLINYVKPGSTLYFETKERVPESLVASCFGPRTDFEPVYHKIGEVGDDGVATDQFIVTKRM